MRLKPIWYYLPCRVENGHENDFSSPFKFMQFTCFHLFYANEEESLFYAMKSLFYVYVEKRKEEKRRGGDLFYVIYFYALQFIFP